MSSSPKMTQLRRDLHMIVRGILGDHPAPFRARARRHADSSPTHIPAPVYEIVDVVRETPDATTLRFRHPSRRPIEFEAGQFFTLLAKVDGQELRRAYSASSSAMETDTATITVKRISGGKVSNFIGDHAQVGDELRLLGPSGAFTVPDQVEHLVLIAGGSGITPMMSIIRTQLAAHPSTRMDLVFGNRSEDDIIFRRALDELTDAHAERLRIRYCLSDPSPSWSGPVGMLDQPHLDALLDELAPGPDAHYFICGPEPMMDAARGSLSSREVAPERVHEERFTGPHRRTTKPKGPAEAHQVRVSLERDTRDVYVPPGQSILEAALDAGLAMPFSCGMGGCGKCRMRVTEGEVEMEEPNCLSEDEKRAQWVLTCVGRPTCRTAVGIT